MLAVFREQANIFRLEKSGVKKCPQNSKVGSKCAPTMAKWGQKVPPLIPQLEGYVKIG